jgi:phage gpG-like protein
MSRIFDLKFLGDIAKLNKLGNDLGRAGATSFLEKLSAKLGATALELVDEGFAKGIAPNGDPWARPRKAHKALIESGELRRSWSASTNAKTATIASSCSHAVFIQRGTKGQNGKRGIGPRKMVPEHRLPLRWKTRLEAVFHEQMKTLFGGRK